MRTQRSDEVVLVGEIAKATGVSRQTAYTWARAGEIPVKWRGGRYELDRRDLPKVIRRLGRVATVTA